MAAKSAPFRVPADVASLASDGVFDVVAVRMAIDRAARPGDAVPPPSSDGAASIALASARSPAACAMRSSPASELANSPTVLAPPAIASAAFDRATAVPVACAEVDSVAATSCARGDPAFGASVRVRMPDLPAMALSRLSEPDRELLLMRAWDGLAIGEIAKILDCTTNAASVRLSKARARLRKELTEKDRPPGGHVVVDLGPEGGPQ